MAVIAVVLRLAKSEPRAVRRMPHGRIQLGASGVQHVALARALETPSHVVPPVGAVAVNLI